MCNEAVATREDVHERTELGDVHDTAHVDLTELRLGRVDDVQDRHLGFLHAPGLDRTDGDDAAGTVVVDADVGSGLLLDRVDDLALRADHFADLVERDVDRGRSSVAVSAISSRVAGRHSFMTPEDLEASHTSLGQSRPTARRRECRRSWCRAGAP